MPTYYMRKIPRSALSGRFVTKLYARRWPGYTVTETVKIRIRRRGR